MTEPVLTIQIMYSCPICPVHKAKLDVPARPSEMDVKVWMDQTVKLIAVDHQRRTPGCPAKSLKDLMIPIEGAEWVGGPPVH